jgi:hypothetical protein
MSLVVAHNRDDGDPNHHDTAGEEIRRRVEPRFYDEVSHQDYQQRRDAATHWMATSQKK